MQQVLNSEYRDETVASSALPRVMMRLGAFSFSVDNLAYDTLKTEVSWNWTEQARIGRRDLLQYTGKKAATRTLEGQAHALLGRSVTAISELYQLGDQLAPQQMVSSSGDVLGFWVIKSVSDSISAHLPGGFARHKTFTMELQFYGNDVSDP